jgi:hypothetical protein
MRRAIAWAGLALSILATSPTAAQVAPQSGDKVLIMCRTATQKPGNTTIDAQTKGLLALPGQVQATPYWNCNVPMPFVPPVGFWFCLKPPHGAFYSNGAGEIGGSGVYGVVAHDMPGHDYHGYTFPASSPGEIYAMPFPGGEPLKLTIAQSGTVTTTVYARLILRGYLGLDSSTPRERACPRGLDL